MVSYGVEPGILPMESFWVAAFRGEVAGHATLLQQHLPQLPRGRRVFWELEGKPADCDWVVVVVSVETWLMLRAVWLAIANAGMVSRRHGRDVGHVGGRCALVVVWLKGIWKEYNAGIQCSRKI